MPLEPIILTSAGDTLYRYQDPRYSDAYSDESPLFGKEIDRDGVLIGSIGSEGAKLYELPNCNVIVCPEFVLRIEIPKEVNTYGKLRKHCADVQARRQFVADKINRLADQVDGPPKWAPASVYDKE